MADEGGRRRVALIGLGAIGRTVADGLLAGTAGGAVELAAVLARPRRAEEARAVLPPAVPVATDLATLLRDPPDRIVECAGHGAVTAHGEAILSAGVDLFAISSGALADRETLGRLRAAARAGRARLLVPAGAIAGLDGLAALALAGLDAVTYVSTKPPGAWKGTLAETVADLDALRERTTVFEGSAREAAAAFPKNANLAATVALAGLGLDDTRVRLVADPAAAGNTGRIEAAGAVGTLTVEMGGAASANPKTSASVAFSLLAAVRDDAAPIVITG